MTNSWCLDGFFGFCQKIDNFGWGAAMPLTGLVRMPQVLQLLLLLLLLVSALMSSLLQQSLALSVSLMAAGGGLALAVLIQLLVAAPAVPGEVSGRDYRERLRSLRSSAAEEPARVAAVLDCWLDEAAADSAGLPLSNAEQAAMILMGLESESAAAVLRELRPARVQQLAGQMSSITAPDAEQLDLLLERFGSDLLRVSLVRPGQAGELRSLLEAALGEEQAALIKGRLELHGQSQQIGKLKWLEPATIADMLSREHPQIQAVVIACLEAAQGAEVLQCFELERRRDLLSRLASLESLSAAALAELDWLIEQYLGDMSHGASRHLAGESLAAALLNELDVAGESALLEGLRERRPGLAERVEDLMFGFEQLQRLGDDDLNVLVAQLNPLTVQCALQGAAGELRGRLQAALQSQHPAVAPRLAGDGRAADIARAQQELVAAAKRLAGVGEIVLDSRGLRAAP